jgi:hypothetical protein
MRTVSKALLLGAGAGAIALLAGGTSDRRRPRRRVVAVPPRHREPRREPDVRADGGEPDAIPSGMIDDYDNPAIQGIDEVVEYHVELIDERNIDPVTQDAALTDPAEQADVPPRSELDEIEALEHDTGDLYGIHTQRAVDTDLPDDRAAFDEGENWIEALEATSVENGPEPEVAIEAVDDEDVDAPPHPSDTRDTPVADRGAGGPAGA